MSSRRVGLNATEQIYDSGSGQDQDDLADWNTETADDLTSGTPWSEGLLVVTGTHVDDVTLAGATCDIDHFRYIKPNTGAFPEGIIKVDGSTAYFKSSNQWDCLSLAENFSQMQDLTASASHASFNGGVFRWTGDAEHSAFVACLAAPDSASGTLAGFKSYNRSDTSGIAYAINCLGKGAAVSDSDNPACYAESERVELIYCGFDGFGGTNGIDEAGGNANVINCWVRNCGSNKDYDSTCDFTTSGASDDSGSPAGLDNQTYSFENSTTGDYRWKSDADDGLGDATPIHAAGNYYVDDDAAGNTRDTTAPDLGPFEFQAPAGGPVMPIFAYYYNQPRI